MPTTTTVTATTMICTERRIPARWAMTRLRMSTSSRAEPASAPSTSRSPGPRSRELRINAAMMMSALGSSMSSASRCRASGSGMRPRSRSISASRCGRSNGPAERAEAGIACSRPTAPAMVSRRDSVHIASASTRCMPSRSCARPPNSWLQKKIRTATPTPTIGQRVISPTPMPTSSAMPSRWPALRSQRPSCICRVSGAFSLGLKPISDAISRATPPPPTMPANSASRVDC